MSRFAVIAVDADVALPYAGTSGWSGSDTSRARATDSDRQGNTKKRQLATLGALLDAGEIGLTVHELDAMFGWNHHGKTSGVLSVLHKAEKIARLTMSRNGCKIYVHTNFINGRITENHGRKKPAVEAIQNLVCGCYCCTSILDRLEKL
jgi:hypothetical protein